MDTLHEQLIKADRLHDVTQRVGFALWQLQELEGTSAMYFVLVAQARFGMGITEGRAQLEKAQSKTFGATVGQLVRGGFLSAETGAQFQALSLERNWLVHSSPASGRDAIHDDGACDRLIRRLDSIAEEASLFAEGSGQPRGGVRQEVPCYASTG